MKFLTSNYESFIVPKRSPKNIHLIHGIGVLKNLFKGLTTQVDRN